MSSDYTTKVPAVKRFWTQKSYSSDKTQTLSPSFDPKIQKNAQKSLYQFKLISFTFLLMYLIWITLSDLNRREVHLLFDIDAKKSSLISSSDINPKRLLSISNPELISQITVSGAVNCFWVATHPIYENIVFETDEGGKIYVFNITKLSNPVLMTTYTTNLGILRAGVILKDGKTLIVADSRPNKGIFILNITDLMNIQQLYNYNASFTRSLIIRASPDEQILYIGAASGPLGITVLNISNVSNPVFISLFTGISVGLHDIRVSDDGNVVFATSFTNRSFGILIINATNKTSLSLMQNIQPNSTLYTYYANFGLTLDEKHIASTTNYGVSLFDIQNLSSPIFLSHFASQGAHNLVISNDNTTLFTESQVSGAGLFIYNIANRSNPRQIGFFKTGATVYHYVELSRDQKTLFITQLGTTCLVILNVSQYYAPCQGMTYYYPNGSCLEDCPSRFVKRFDGYDYCDDNPCKPNIVANHQYYEDGYCISCPVYCSACQNGTFCSACFWPAVIENDLCVCPPGSELNSSNICSSIFDVNIILDMIIDPLNIGIQVNLSDKELSTYPSRNYSWSLLSNSSNFTRLNLINSYLNKQTNYTISIPYRILEPYVVYNLTCVYNNSLNELITTTIILPSLSFLFPQVSSPLDTQLKLDRHLSNTLTNNYIMNPSSLFYGYYKTDWQVLNGNISTYSTSIREFFIPACTLQKNSSFSVRASIYYDPNPLFNATIFINFTSQPDQYQVEVKYLGRQQPFNLPITINASVSPVNSCPDTETNGVQYVWSCEKSVDMGGTFNACPSGSVDYGIMTTIDYMIIPQTAFAQGNILKISVRAIKDGQVFVKSGQINILNERTLILGITCINPPCQKYNSNANLYLQTVIQNNPGVKIKITMSVIPNVPHVNFDNLLYINADTSNINTNQLLITAQVVDSYYSGSADFTIPINTAPENGSLIVYPTSGTSLTTSFLITAVNWTDSDLPLSYQFFFSSLNTTFSILPKQGSNYLTCFLPSGDEGIVPLSVSVSDNYGASSLATTSVIMEKLSADVSITYDKVNSLISALNISNPSRVIDELPLVSNQAVLAEAAFLSLRNQLISCTGCPRDEISCLTGNCTCKNGTNETVDCSLSQSQFENIVKIKSDILNVLKQTYEKLDLNGGDTGRLDSIISMMKILTLNAEFVSLQTISDVKEIMDNSLNFTSKNKNFTIAQNSEANGLVNNLIDYFHENDCNCTSFQCKDLRNTTQSYIDRLSQASLRNKVPGEDSFSFISTYFDITTVSKSICELSNLTIQTSSLSPAVTLYPKGSYSGDDCLRIVDVTIYSFKNDTFGCMPSGLKNLLMVDIVDRTTGESIKDLFKAKIILPPGVPCYSECINRGNFCDCELEIFDVTKQISKIFRMSSLGDVKNVRSLLDWIWYESPIFWWNLAAFLWWLLSYVSFKIFKSLDKFSILDKIALKARLRPSMGYIYMLLVISDISSIYIVRTEIPKRLRLVIYYLKIVLYGTYVALFQSSGATKGILDLISNLQFYIIILPLLTVTPITAIFSAFLTNLMRREKKAGLRNVFIGMMTLTLTGGCVFVMFIIASNKDINYQYQWTSSALLAILQDLIILPNLLLMLQLILFKKRSNVVKKNRNTLKSRLINQDCLMIFSKISSKPDLQRVYPLEIMDENELEMNQGTLVRIKSQKSEEIEPDARRVPESLLNLNKTSRKSLKAARSEMVIYEN